MLRGALLFTEPLLERWPFSVAYQHEGAQLRLMFSSDACLNLVATPAAFRSIGDARSFLQALATPATSAAAPAAASAAAVTTSKVASLCSNYRQAPLIIFQHERCCLHARAVLMPDAHLSSFPLTLHDGKAVRVAAKVGIFAV